MLRSRALLAEAANALIRPRPWYPVFESLRPDDEQLASDGLAALLRHAASSVPYYRRHWAGRPAPQTLDEWPVVRRTDLQHDVTPFISDGASSAQAYWNSSGGSTGAPVRILQDSAFSRWCAATEHYFCVSLLKVPDYETEPTLLLWGSERDLQRSASFGRRCADWLLQRETFNSFSLTDAVMRDVLHRLETVTYAVVKGYAGSLHEVARFGLAQHAVIRAPKAVHSSAEQLRPAMRRDIERFFGTKVHDFYGSREVGAIAGECAAGFMHVFSFNNVLELLDDDGRPVPAGEPGRVVVTTLHNYSMPLIRYELGDVAVAAGRCSCGSSLPCLSRIEGRITDQFITPDGGRISGEYFTHLFYFNDTVLRFQVVQRSLEEIEVLYVPCSRGAVLDRGGIAEKIRRVMGSQCRIVWSERADLPPSPQGKRLFTRSEVLARPRESLKR